jgi:hypothetical protein
VTAAGELAAVRGVARRLRSTRGTVDTRQATALASSLDTAARNLARHVEHLQGEIPPPDGDGYAGLDAEHAAARYTSAVNRLAVEGAPATKLQAERLAFLRHFATIAPRRAPRASGVASASPTVNAPGRTARAATETSRRAALAVLPKTGGQRRRILDAVAAVARTPGVVGLTDVQLATSTGLPPNTVRPRRGELVAGGWLEPADTKREHHGREHTVWCLTQKAAASAELWATIPRA